MTPYRPLVRMLVACIAGLVVLAAVPAAAGTEPAFIAIKGIEYAPRVGNAHVLDLYLPTHARGPVPVIVWSAGSAWLGDNGNQGGEVLAQHFTPHGFAVAPANPATYASRDDPPFLILHGTADLLVPHHQSEVLFQALHRACDEVGFTSLGGPGPQARLPGRDGPALHAPQHAGLPRLRPRAQLHRTASHLGRAGAPTDPDAGRPGPPRRLTMQI